MNAGATGIDGYVADAAYPMHFHREQMPAWLDAAQIARAHGGPATGPRELFAPALDALVQGPATFAALRTHAPYDAAPGLLNQAGRLRACLPSSRDAAADALARQLAPLPGVPALALLPAIGSAAPRQVPR